MNSDSFPPSRPYRAIILSPNKPWSCIPIGPTDCHTFYSLNLTWRHFQLSPLTAAEHPTISSRGKTMQAGEMKHCSSHKRGDIFPQCVSIHSCRGGTHGGIALQTCSVWKTQAQKARSWILLKLSGCLDPLQPVLVLILTVLVFRSFMLYIPLCYYPPLQ